MRRASVACLSLIVSLAWGQSGTITIDASKKGADVPKGLYGVFLEEISHAGEGGLYGELLQNRGFEDANIPPACDVMNGQLVPPRSPHYWSLKPSDWTMPWESRGPFPGWSLMSGPTSANLAVVGDHPLNSTKSHALSIDVHHAPAIIGNQGFWGIALKKGESYNLRAWIQADRTFRGPISAQLISAQGRVIAESKWVGIQSGHYSLVTSRLLATESDPKAHFAIKLGSTGKVWIAYASLFPVKTFLNRPNGLRPDLAKMVADLRPGFVRFPGGCYVEGLTVETRAQWQQTLGPLEARIPTYSPWGYWNNNGFGYHEWLQFCEDIKAEPLYVFNVGVSCAFRSGTFLPDDQLPALIQNTLDAIEYANGPLTSKWGAMRAQNGHPKPFAMKYVEIGNEQQGPRYGARVGKFYRAIKAKYPHVKVILSSWISGIDHAAINAAGPIDFVDEHAYTSLNWALYNFDSFAKYPRNVSWKLYIGEFACNGGVGSGNMAATLNDAAYMMSMEKNSDLVKMGSYAPLFENVNSPHWDVNMIHFDAARSFGRATYYAGKMFAENLPQYNVGTSVRLDSSNDQPLSGPIGLGTFATEAEFKDLTVIQNGKTVLENNFATQADGWKSERSAAWQIVDGAYGQRSKLEGDECFSFFGNGFHDIDLSVSARKIRGTEGFFVSVGNIDGMRVQVNLGGWGNSLHAIQINSGSAVASIRGHIETGRWYAVKVVTRGRSIQVFLDGQQILSKELPRSRTVLAISGVDPKNHDVVVKVVNTQTTPAPMTLRLTGMGPVGPSGTAVTLASPNETDENSFDSPTRITPHTTHLTGLRNQFRYTFPANSLTILRIKASPTKHLGASRL